MKTECISGKQFFSNELSVATAAVYFEGQRTEILYWYTCPTCKGYHLTHSNIGKNVLYFSKYKKSILTKQNINCTLETKTIELTSAEIKDKRKCFLSNDPTIEDRKKWNIQYPSHLVSVIPDNLKLNKNTLEDNYLNNKATLEDILTFNKNNPEFACDIEKLKIRRVKIKEKIEKFSKIKVLI